MERMNQNNQIGLDTCRSHQINLQDDANYCMVVLILFSYYSKWLPSFTSLLAEQLSGRIIIFNLSFPVFDT